MSIVRVALVEDDAFIRTTTAAYLARQPGLSCDIVAGSAEELLEELQLAIPPHVVLLDIGLPGISGLKAIPHILRLVPGAHILMQTVLDDSDTVYAALCQGAMGYVLKDLLLPDLATAVHEVMQGGTPFSRSVSRLVLAHFKPTPRLQAELLSPRERQVLEGLVEGLMAKEVAERLGLGVTSVRSHIRGIYGKLQVRTRSQLLSRALRGDL